MRFCATRWLTRGIGTTLALIVSTTFAHGDYSPPTQAGGILGEFAAFVGDFGQWNASQNNMPLQILQITPAANEPQAVLALFWLWLQDGGAGNGSAGIASNMGQGSPNGSIIAGQSGNGSLANGANDPPGLGGKGGGSSLLSGASSPGGTSGDPIGGSPVSGVSAGPGGSSATPFADAPEPASFTLLAVGGAGLLMGRWVRRRRGVPA